MPKKGRQTPTQSMILPYSKSKGQEAVKLYDASKRKAIKWQKDLLRDIMAVNKQGLWVHQKFGYSVPRRNGKNEVLSMRLLVPIVFRPDARRPFGHSRISRACMSIMSEALRTVKRSEISAEFYSFPQRWATGIDQNAEEMDKWKATMSAMLKFTVNDDGEDKVRLGQFSQQSMEPHISQLRMFASLFSGETGLTLDDLGFPSDNPSSAEAIKATHENIRLTASRAQQTFGSGFLNTGYLAACVRDNFKYKRQQIYLTKAKWLPVFEPDASMLGAIGDGLSKLEMAFPGYVKEDVLQGLVGF